jgi:hypothetical protein
MKDQFPQIVKLSNIYYLYSKWNMSGAFEPKTKLSTNLQKLAHATNSSTDFTSKHIADATHLVNRVMEFMKSRLSRTHGVRTHVGIV